MEKHQTFGTGRLSFLVIIHHLPIEFEGAVVGFVIADLHDLRMIEIGVERVGKDEAEILLVVVHGHMIAVFLVDGCKWWCR